MLEFWSIINDELLCKHPVFFTVHMHCNCSSCIAYLKSLVTKEMDLVIFTFHILQAVRFVPALRKNIKTYLSTYGVCQPQMRKFVPEDANKLFPATSPKRLEGSGRDSAKEQINGNTCHAARDQ